jgi:hypothetical protein
MDGDGQGLSIATKETSLVLSCAQRLHLGPGFSPMPAAQILDVVLRAAGLMGSRDITRVNHRGWITDERISGSFIERGQKSLMRN